MRPCSNSAKENATYLSGIILAGGKSTRFDRDKSRMEISGRSVLAHHFFPQHEFANINTPEDYERVSKLIRKADD